MIPIQVDIINSQIICEGTYTIMTGKPFYMLCKLLTNPDKVITRGNVIADLGEYDILQRTIDVWTCKARKVLYTYGYNNVIQSVRGMGYIYRPNTLIEVRKW